ncbi:MAG: hypothetical protein PF542_03490 [Nanoarchaeota archaeon]|jgi:hypothetical protein|nr:hypothetical protein [Nanoarchaeota archaeon]
MNSTKEYLERREKFRIKDREDWDLRKKEISDILKKYSLDGDYCGKNSPYGEGKEGDGNFGQVINNFLIGHTLGNFLEHDIPEEMSYSRIFPFGYNEDELKDLGIYGNKYSLPHFVRGEDAFNRLKSSNKILEAYKKSPIEKEDIEDIFKIGSKSIITKAEDFLDICYGWDHHISDENKYRRNFEKVLNGRENNLAKKWGESWEWINYIAKTAPTLKDFEPLEDEIYSYLIKKWEENN